jgi:hypothetical protein
MDSRHPLVVVAVITAIVLGLYMFMSPYQNCLRNRIHNTDNSEVKAMATNWCNANTGW